MNGLRAAHGFILATLFALTPLAMANPADAAAAEFVQRQRLGSNLKTLALVAARRTQTFAMIASRLGMTEAQLLVSKELDANAGKFQGQWDANLTRIYARHFTPAELASLASEGRSSPFANKLAAKQEVIGAEMQQQSTPIVASYVSSAMTGAFARMSDLTRR